MVIIKRTPHPNPEHRKITRRWFTYRGRDFGVTHAGPGYGWEVFDLEECSGVEDGYSNLDEVRRQAPHDIELWAADNDVELGIGA